MTENPGKCPHIDCEDKVICAADAPIKSFDETWSCYTPKIIKDDSYKKKLRNAKIIMYIGIFVTMLGIVSALIVTILFLLGVIE